MKQQLGEISLGCFAFVGNVLSACLVEMQLDKVEEIKNSSFLIAAKASDKTVMKDAQSNFK